VSERLIEPATKQLDAEWLVRDEPGECHTVAVDINVLNAEAGSPLYFALGPLLTIGVLGARLGLFPPRLDICLYSLRLLCR
jgi:hypothetical protein